ncbi:putative WRKY transcription factor, plant [Helianthus annuus]|nr:putative WRKY transcription factor, plant [Helianthus annuus]KAJ0471438.1 putative WRKY transcription factor, plant [Helianthus annuus]
MESSSWPESLPSNRIKAMQELTQGQVLMNKLQEMLDQPEKIEFGYNPVDDTLVQIVGMFNKTLSILSSNSPTFNKTPQNRTHDMSSPNNWDDQWSENSIESVKTVMPIKTKRGCHKRRYVILNFT